MDYKKYEKFNYRKWYKYIEKEYFKLLEKYDMFLFFKGVKKNLLFRNNIINSKRINF